MDGEVRGGRRGRQRQREGLQRGPHHTDEERPPLWPRKVICSTGTEEGRRKDRGGKEYRGGQRRREARGGEREGERTEDRREEGVRIEVEKRRENRG